MDKDDEISRAERQVLISRFSCFNKSRLWDDFAKKVFDSLPPEKIQLKNWLPQALAFFKTMFSYRSFYEFRRFWTDKTLPALALSIEPMSLPAPIASYDIPLVRRFIGLLQNFSPGRNPDTDNYHLRLILLSGSGVILQLWKDRQDTGANDAESGKHARTVYGHILDTYTIHMTAAVVDELRQLQSGQSKVIYVLYVIDGLRRRFKDGCATLLPPDLGFRYDCTP